jgi:osmoprotectant transport system substrate-binding protein
MLARPAHRIFPWPLVLAAVIVPLAAGCGAGDQGGAAAKEDEARIAGHQFRLSGTQRDAQFTVGGVEGFTEQEVPSPRPGK